MSVATVVTRGYGSFGSSTFVVTRGYSIGRGPTLWANEETGSTAWSNDETGSTLWHDGELI